MNPRQFTQSTDYVNIGPVRAYPSDHPTTSTGELDSLRNNRFQQTQNTPYSRSLASITPKMPEQHFFAPTSLIFKEDSDTAGRPNVAGRGNEQDAFLRRKLPDGDPNSEKPTSAQAPSHDEPSTNKPVQKRRRQAMKPEPKDYKRILIGSVEHVIRWYKVAKSAQLSFLYEAVGTLENYTVRGSAQLLFLKGDLGQIIQGLFYSVDYGLLNLESGATYSMTGKMVGSHKMMVIDAQKMHCKEKAAVQRLSFLCQRMLNLAAGNLADANI